MSVYVWSWFRKLQIPKYRGHGMRIKSGSHEARLSVLAKALKTASSKNRPAETTARRAKGAGQGRIDVISVMLTPKVRASDGRSSYGRMPAVSE